MENKWPIAKEGIPFIFAGFSLSLLFVFLGIYWVSAAFGILTLFVISFFRDPERTHDAPESAVLTPADGTVCQILKISGNENPLGVPAAKVSIFMSIFNVHVNRAPVSGMVRKVVYRPGAFFSANLDKASEQNESNAVTLLLPDGREIVVVQVAGLIARRIVCWVKEGDTIEKGKRFGLIRFGSRLDVYIPYESNIKVEPGQKVRAGHTAIAYL